MKRAQSSRESPAAGEERTEEKMEMKNRRQKPSWSHDSALLLVAGRRRGGLSQYRGSREGRGARQQMGDHLHNTCIDIQQKAHILTQK